ncbi:hypothetical protein BRAS3843_1730004 [Bradyrhizobium sp. STM 3843]|nr:hypothetical protein BRAS3843_1730004 [Bradyrhizobium sp. STM 3843]
MPKRDMAASIPHCVNLLRNAATHYRWGYFRAQYSSQRCLENIFLTATLLLFGNSTLNMRDQSAPLALNPRYAD